MKKTAYALIFLLIACVFYIALTRDYSATISYREDKTALAASPPPLLFVGDIMLGRYVETLALREGNEQRSFERISKLLSEHTTIANLEGPIPLVHVQTPINGFSFSMPSSTPRVLKDGGIAAVSLANNHMFDKGRSGYEETKNALSSVHIPHFGGYAPTTEDYFKTSIGEMPVIVYGITMIATGWDEEQALAVTEKLVEDHPDAHLIAYLHWGDEYSPQNIHQRSFAHKLIDRGVDTIIGSHPHVPQGVEVYEGKPIFYSLGNFIFDQYWHKDTEKGYMVKMSDNQFSLIYEIIPVMQSRSVAYVATSTARDGILSDISARSETALKSAIAQGVFTIPK